MLISENYRALNRELHDTEPKYGAGGMNWAGVVFKMRQDGCDSVLDYGCGKGVLGELFGHPDWLKEYDPAIAGKDAEPQAADLVLCTDVLEHVEPDCLDDVLKHIEKLTKQMAVFNISTRPAAKTLPDGRNAHLNIQDAAWWGDKLKERFHVDELSVGTEQVIARCRRLLLVGEIRTKSAVAVELRYDQYLANAGKVTQRVLKASDLPCPAHKRLATIACFGPSLRDTWEDIRLEKEAGKSFLVSVSGAHNFLIDKGIIPDVHIECDPREHKAFFTKQPLSGIQYWIASCCHPKLIDQLLPYDISLWHAMNSEYDMKILDHEPDGALIAGKGTVGLRATSVLFTLGFRRFSIHGMDCAHSEDGTRHAGEHSGKVQKMQAVRCGNRTFQSNLGMISAARSFIDNMKEFEAQAQKWDEAPRYRGERLEWHLHGDGLLQEMVKVGMEQAA